MYNYIPQVYNLNEGLSYYFRVIAINEHGQSVPCEMRTAIIASELPSPPLRLVVTDSTSKAVSLSWRKPLSDGGSKVTGMWLVEKTMCGYCRRITLCAAVIERVPLIVGYSYA